jgi:hypothetical protein
VLAGLTIARDTNPATRTFVDAHITISGDATPDSGTQHSFTVAVTRDNGTGAGAVNAPAGTKPVVTLTAANGAGVHVDSDTCATTGTIGGTCRVTVTLTKPGAITAVASVTLDVNGVEVSRTARVRDEARTSWPGPSPLASPPAGSDPRRE